MISFPLGSTDWNSVIMKDRALDSAGVTMPLLHLLEIPSRCTAPASSQSSIDDGASDQDGPEEDEEDVDRYLSGGDENLKTKIRKQHPFVITK